MSEPLSCFLVKVALVAMAFFAGYGLAAFLEDRER